jgi:hypothetical protein
MIGMYLCVKRWEIPDELGILRPFFRGLVWNGKAPYDILKIYNYYK